MNNIIVFVNSFKSWGSNKVWANLSNLLKEDCNIKLIWLYNWKIWFKEIENIDHIYLSKRTSNNSFIKLIHLIDWIFSFYQEISRFKPKKIVTFSMETTFITLFLKFISYNKFDIVMTQHEEKIFINQFTALNWFIYKIFLYFIRFFQRHIKAVICVSENVKNTMLYFWFNEKLLKVIYNSVNINKIKLLGKESCKVSEPFIINVGTYSEIKNQLFLIRSFALLKNKITENLVFLWNWKDSNYFNKMINEVNVLWISSRVIFLDFSENPYKYIAKSRVVCSTSFTESFGLSLIEWMTLGIPVISTEHWGAKEILWDSVYWICSPFNEKIYSEKLLEILNDELKYRKYRKRWQERVSNFSSSKQYELYKEIILN